MELSLFDQRRRKAVGSAHNVRVKYSKKTIDVSGAQSCKKRFDGFTLFRKRGTRTSARAPHTPARPARQLPCRSRGPSYNGGDIFESNVEHVVQHEGNPLGWSKPFEDNQERQTDGLSKSRFIFRVNAFRVHRRPRLSPFHFQRLLAS
jgi:hypothetical protein